MYKYLKKIKYNCECGNQNKCVKIPVITTHVNNIIENNNNLKNNVIYYNCMAAATVTANAITTSTISTITTTRTTTKTNGNNTVIMLENSKGMITATATAYAPRIVTTTTKMLYDRLINVISNIQNCYHRYYNDLFIGCNIKNRTNKRRHQCSKRRSKRKILKIKHKKPKPKLLLNTISSVNINNNSNNNNNNNNNNNFNKNNLFNKTIIKNSCCINVANVCNCEYSHRDYKKNLNISYQNSDYLRHFCFYIQKNFNSLRLLIVIFILALITSTAHSIDDTQGKPQRKSTSLTSPLKRLHSSSALAPHLPPPPLPPSTIASVNITSGTLENLTDSIIHLPCYHKQKYNFKTLACCNQRHLRHQHRKSKLINLNRFSQSTRTCGNKQIIKDVYIHYQKSKPQIDHINHYHHQHHQRRHHDYDYQNNSNNLGDLFLKKYNFITKVIKFENILNNNNITNNNTRYMRGEDEYKEEINEDMQNINNKLNINKFLHHFQMSDNNYKHNTHNENSISSNDTLLSNKLKNIENYKPKDDVKEIDEEKVNNTNIITDHLTVNDHHNHDDFDYFEDKDENNNSLSTVTTATMKTMATIATLDSTKVNSTIYTTLQQIHLQEEPEPTQYIDYEKLMKLVMDGLGLKQPPDMKNVNISQREYATKYREYLQRVHTQKRRYLKEDGRLDDYDESLLRPLQFFSIISNSSLLNYHQEYSSYNEISLMRQKRYAQRSKENQQSENRELNAEGNDRKQTLEERVKNVLFLRKKYQKPRSTKKQREERKTNIRLMFALKPDILNLSSSDIEEANTRLVLIHSPILSIRNSKNKNSDVKKPKNLCNIDTNEGQKGNHQMNVLNLKLYFLPKIGKRILLDGQKVDIVVDLTKPDETHTQWLQFDVTKAIKMTLNDKRLEHVALELQCDNCKRVGARILNDAYDTAAEAQADYSSNEAHQLMPVLNIIGRFEQSQHSMRPHKYESYHKGNTHSEESTTQRHYHHQAYNKNRHNRRTNCYKSNQRCCRHSMEVTFKEIKGFEFIIQPKVFDAGYCHGRCPPRYNPAHHHAMLQSLIWKQNHHKAPRPCCAPSKLVELEVLHVDEKDSEKLKISTWSDMKVVECACS